MSLLGARAMTRQRFATAGTWGSDGLKTEPSSTDTTIQATGPQPLSGVDLKTLTEAERASDLRKIYSETELRTLNQHDDRAADRIVIDGVTYEVRKVFPQPAIIPHWKALIVRLVEADA